MHGKYYQILGVNPAATPADIYQAFLKIGWSDKYFLDDEYSFIIHRACQVLLQARTSYNRFLNRFAKDLEKNQPSSNLYSILFQAIIRRNKNYVSFLLEEIFLFDMATNAALVSLFTSIVQNARYQALQWLKTIILNSGCNPFLKFHLIDILHENCKLLEYVGEDLDFIVEQNLWLAFFKRYGVFAVALCIKSSRTATLSSPFYFQNLLPGSVEMLFCAWLDIKERGDTLTVFNFLINNGVKPSFKIFSETLSQIPVLGIKHFQILLEYQRTNPTLGSAEKQELLESGITDRQDQEKMVTVFKLLLLVETVISEETLELALAFIKLNGKYLFKAYQSSLSSLTDDALDKLFTWSSKDHLKYTEKMFIDFVEEVKNNYTKRQTKSEDITPTVNNGSSSHGTFWTPSGITSANLRSPANNSVQYTLLPDRGETDLKPPTMCF